MEDRGGPAVYFSCRECISPLVALGLIGNDGSCEVLVLVCGRGCGCE